MRDVAFYLAIGWLIGISVAVTSYRAYLIYDHCKIVQPDDKFRCFLREDNKE